MTFFYRLSHKLQAMNRWQTVTFFVGLWALMLIGSYFRPIEPQTAPQRVVVILIFT